jgi:hypothetical protein
MKRMVLEDKKDAQVVSPGGKKPYRKPQLQIYGDLNTITRAVTTGKNEDKYSPGPSDMT